MSSSTGNLKYQNGIQNQMNSSQQKYIPYQNTTQYGNYTTGSQGYGSASGYSSYQPSYGNQNNQSYSVNGGGYQMNSSIK